MASKGVFAHELFPWAERRRRFDRYGKPLRARKRPEDLRRNARTDRGRAETHRLTA